MLTFIQGCSKFNDDLAIPEENVSEINLPKESEEYGKAVAKEIRLMVDNLNEKGYNFASIKTKKDVAQFYQEAYGASSLPKLKSNSPTPLNINPIDIQKSNEQLTDNQRRVINQIIKIHGERKSDQDFKKSLIDLNGDIYETVPKIEQERLFNITSILYYTISEIQHMEKNGKLIRHHSNNLTQKNIPRLKSFSEDDDGGSGSCRQEQSAFAIAIGYINSVGEKVTSVTQAAAGALGAFIITWCMQRELTYQEICGDIYERCATTGSSYWTSIMPGTSMTRCGQCLTQCVSSQGNWPCGDNFN